jgi:hypothetical protein
MVQMNMFEQAALGPDHEERKKLCTRPWEGQNKQNISPLPLNQDAHVDVNVNVTLPPGSIASHSAP